MHIKLKQLRLMNFKNHKKLTIDFEEITRILGKNGAGKSSIGEGVTWLFYGVDPLGNQMSKELSPEPTNYDFEQVEAHLLFTVDEKQILLGKVLPKGKPVKHYINEVPKKAGEFNAFVDELFNKQLFLSLFSPPFFFTQHWEEQRKQLLSYVLPPSNKEVFAQLPVSQAEKLAVLVKKKSLDDLQAQHAENRKKQDKALIAAKSRTKTLEEQLQSMPDTNGIDGSALAEKLLEIHEKISTHANETAAARESDSRVERLKTQIISTRDTASRVSNDYNQLKNTPINDTCHACGQMLTDEAIEHTKEQRQKNLDELKYKHQTMVDQYKRMKEEFLGLEVVDISDVSELIQQRSEIEAQLKTIESQDRLAIAIEEAKQNERDIHESYTESVFILDAIKAFRAKEAEMMAEKVSGLFERLTLKLFTENKGDGEQKPWFEVEMDGKPYRKLSTAEKILAGLELISVLSEQSGVTAPTFIDNAESIIKYQAPSGQLIECRVADMPLTVQEVQ